MQHLHVIILMVSGIIKIIIINIITIRTSVPEYQLQLIPILRCDLERINVTMEIIIVIEDRLQFPHRITSKCCHFLMNQLICYHNLIKNNFKSISMSSFPLSIENNQLLMESSYFFDIGNCLNVFFIQLMNFFFF